MDTHALQLIGIFTINLIADFQNAINLIADFQTRTNLIVDFSKCN